MFPVQNTQASSASRHSNQDVPPVPERKTSTRVVNSLARGLLASSRGQASIAHYVDLQFRAGKTPSAVQSKWIGLRTIASQMSVVEQHALQAGRPLSSRDRELAARRSANCLHEVVKNIHPQDRFHPSFRKELIEHLENIIRWYPRADFAWGLAYKNMWTGELIRYKGRMFNKEGCRSIMYHLHNEAAKVQAANGGGFVPRPRDNNK